MNNNNYKVGEKIKYTVTKMKGKYVPDRLAHTELGTIVKTYYDGSAMVVNDLFDEGEKYQIIEAEQILEKVYDPSPLAGLMIDILERVMPLEYWALATLAISILIGIGGKL